MLIRLFEMAVQTLAVGLLNAGTGQSLPGRFTIWDGRLYAQIATYGYPRTIALSPSHALVSGNNLAFLPMYPALVSGVNNTTHVGVFDAELLVAASSACCLSVLIHLIVRASGGSRAYGYAACSLIGWLPMAVVLQMGYAEALFAALGAAAFLAALRGRWAWAGWLAFVAGLTRPIGYVAVAPLPFIGWAQRRNTVAPQGRPRKTTITGASALGLSSTPLYWAYVAIRTHHLGGWFTVEQAGWGTHFDGGKSTARFVWSTLRRPVATPTLAWYVVVLLIATAAVIISVATRANLPYVVAAAAAVMSIVASTNFWHSKPRLLLAAALLVVPVAGYLTSLRLRYLLPLLGFGLTLSALFGAYMVTRWPYAI